TPPERHMGMLGNRLRLRALLVAEDNTGISGSIVYADRFSWSSDTPEVALVRDSGWVTSVGPGTATITVESAGLTGTTTLTVEDAARIAWSLPLGLDAHANAGLTLGHDGTAYVGTGSELLALDPSGDLRWAVPAQGGVQSAPAIASDGTIYFTAVAGPDGSSLTAVSSSGTVLWDVPSRGSVVASPPIGENGTIYFATTDTALYAISPDGEQLWHYRTEHGVL